MKIDNNRKNQAFSSILVESRKMSRKMSLGNQRSQSQENEASLRNQLMAQAQKPNLQDEPIVKMVEEEPNNLPQKPQNQKYKRNPIHIYNS